MKAIRIQNPRSFLVDDVADCLIEMLKTNTQADPGKAFLALQQYSTDWDTGIFITDDFKGAAVCVLPSTDLTEYASIYHFNGSGEHRDVLMNAITDFCREHKIKRIKTANMNTKDRGFKKLFSRYGEVNRVGTLFELEVRT